MRTTLLYSAPTHNTSSPSSRADNHTSAKMTRAQQTVSIGLLFASVCKPSFHSPSYITYEQHQLTTDIALPRTLSTTHPTSKHNFSGNNTSCTSWLLCLSLAISAPPSCLIPEPTQSLQGIRSFSHVRITSSLDMLLILLPSFPSGVSSLSVPTSYSNLATVSLHSTTSQRRMQNS